MRIVFMGTPSFAVPSLSALVAAGHEVALVVTRPDAVRSRGKRLEPSAVKAAAQEMGIPVLEASRMDAAALDAVSEAAPDVICVAAFGCLLPDALIAMATVGCINVHASLLPRWRGAAPIQRAILAGDERQGISIMAVAHELDAGAYCRQASIDAHDKNASQLTSELAQLGATELVSALAQMQDGTVTWTKQYEPLVTLAPKVMKPELRLDPTQTATVNCRRVAASSDAAPARLCIGDHGMRAMTATGLRRPQGPSWRGRGFPWPCRPGMCRRRARGAFGETRRQAGDACLGVGGRPS
jgi:methionyl-tRNA formyltransferase